MTVPSLLSTVHFSGSFALLDGHLRRLRRSAAALAAHYHDAGPFANEKMPSDEAIVAAMRAAVDKMGSGAEQRVRVLVDGEGEVRVEASVFERPAATAHGDRVVVLDDRPLRETHDGLVFMRNKTSERRVYDDARARRGVAAAPASDAVFDVLLYTEDGYVTECCIANIAVEIERDRWVTPPVSDLRPILPGVYREWLLAQGQLEEMPIDIDLLKDCISRGMRVKCFNALRGEYFVTIRF